jgi:hypothetical protein
VAPLALRQGWLFSGIAFMIARTCGGVLFAAGLFLTGFAARGRRPSDPRQVGDLELPAGAVVAPGSARSDVIYILTRQ